MKDVFKHITANGKQYPFVFNINVIQAISQKYGKSNGLQVWSEAVQPKDGSEPDIEALVFFCKEAINEGIDMENDPDDPHYVQGTPRAFINDKQAGRIISAASDFNQMTINTIRESFDTGKEKNSMTEQNLTTTQ